MSEQRTEKKLNQYRNFGFCNSIKMNIAKIFHIKISKNKQIPAVFVSKSTYPLSLLTSQMLHLWDFVWISRPIKLHFGKIIWISDQIYSKIPKILSTSSYRNVISRRFRKEKNHKMWHPCSAYKGVILTMIEQWSKSVHRHKEIK